MKPGRLRMAFAKSACICLLLVMFIVETGEVRAVGETLSQAIAGMELSGECKKNLEFLSAYVFTEAAVEQDGNLKEARDELHAWVTSSFEKNAVEEFMAGAVGGVERSAFEDDGSTAVTREKRRAYNEEECKNMRLVAVDETNIEAFLKGMHFSSVNSPDVPKLEQYAGSVSISWTDKSTMKVHNWPENTFLKLRADKIRFYNLDFRSHSIRAAAVIGRASTEQDGSAFAALQEILSGNTAGRATENPGSVFTVISAINSAASIEKGAIYWSFGTVGNVKAPRILVTIVDSSTEVQLQAQQGGGIPTIRMSKAWSDLKPTFDLVRAKDTKDAAQKAKDTTAMRWYISGEKWETSEDRMIFLDEDGHKRLATFQCGSDAFEIKRKTVELASTFIKTEMNTAIEWLLDGTSPELKGQKMKFSAKKGFLQMEAPGHVFSPILKRIDSIRGRPTAGIVTFQEAYAEATVYPDNTYDVVVSFLGTKSTSSSENGGPSLVRVKLERKAGRD
eukprot:GHVS01086261.1.p1 GENE.GHVS01086261.1~~GHVS01086261.1.p1  ORF type:complete len:505 (+),score=41.02 GHVS01086261.1:123-1637(+)